MLTPGMKDREIWAYKVPIDFRKQMNGLIQVVTDEMGLRANSGSLYIFRNRQKDKLKVLMWDRNGFVLGYKRLERGRFDMPTETTGALQMTEEELLMLVSGMPMIRVGQSTEKEVCFS